MEKIYEDISVDANEDLLKGLNRIIETIDYDPSKVQKKVFNPHITKEMAFSRVSPEALNEIIKNNRDVATTDCNLYKFNNINIEFLSKIFYKFVKNKGIIDQKGIKDFGLSGRIWYPVNGFMGWHTNSNSKGYRIYCTYAKEKDKSFFRFRDINTGEIITSWDKSGWNLRMFKIGDEHLWHSVFSETDRFSIGYLLKK